MRAHPSNYYIQLDSCPFCECFPRMKIGQSSRLGSVQCAFKLNFYSRICSCLGCTKALETFGSLCPELFSSSEGRGPDLTTWSNWRALLRKVKIVRSNGDVVPFEFLQKLVLNTNHTGQGMVRGSRDNSLGRGGSAFVCSGDWHPIYSLNLPDETRTSLQKRLSLSGSWDFCIPTDCSSRSFHSLFPWKSIRGFTYAQRTWFIYGPDCSQRWYFQPSAAAHLRGHSVDTSFGREAEYMKGLSHSAHAFADLIHDHHYSKLHPNGFRLSDPVRNSDHQFEYTYWPLD